ncbi:hypothetical protein LOK49_LG07G02609 [Camellia lanceoleosa]|uniref:Uncharacterized protein n=1 Tax=Camellia lanceoleosa TaxID=1840588 RepID=A0ACC0H0D1_9ERIC|nr:hypothetical protein LOK49_LG07G02609 [Camellia lanceoleosa]
MDIQIPTDLIRQVQTSLREDAGLSFYDPQDPTLPALSSLCELVAGFDPSPPYLRCKHCKGRLMRGVQSMICVYCGKSQSKDLPPQPIIFKSTFGYQWLLQSLDLDGSEPVGPSIEENELNRGHNTPEDEIALSDLLNLEITWPAKPESEKTEHSLTNSAQVQSKSSLNLAGVDLDNFFTESKRDFVSNALEEQPEINKQSENVEMNAFASQENFSLFQNVQHSETPVSASEVKHDDGFSGWKADFQSADSGNQHEGARSFDPFVGSTVDLSAHMDSIFGPGKDVADEKSASTPLALATNDDFLASSQADKVDETIKSKDGITADNLYNNSSTSIDWFPDDQWLTNSMIVPDNKTSSEDDDSFGVWNDFTSSTSAQNPSKNSFTQHGNQIATTDEKTSDIIFPSSTNNFQAMDFGSFSQPDLSSGSFSNQNGSFEVNNTESGVPALDRMADVKVEGVTVGQADEGGDMFNSAVPSKDDVESLLSQMHDLSFMLKSNLSVPSK